MQFVVRWWAVASATLVAQSLPMIFEEKLVIAVSDLAYTAFGAPPPSTDRGALITAGAYQP